MPKKNETRVISITDQGKTGDGIGFLDGLPMYIPNCIPGDLVQIKVVKVEKRRGYGKLVEILEASNNRVEPLCNVAIQCGGCQLQHQSQDSQLHFKQKLLIDRLGRFIELDSVNVLNMIPSNNQYMFRNKMQFSFAMVDGKLHIGLYAARSHRVVNARKCPIMFPAMNAVINAIRGWHQIQCISVFNESQGVGVLRHLTIRYSSSTQSLMVIITVAQALPDVNGLVDALRRVSGLACVFISTQSNPSDDSVIGDTLECIWESGGGQYIVDNIAGHQCRISPRSFVQGNALMVDTLYQTLINHLQWDGHGQLIDLYCGTGSLTMALAAVGGQVIGVDDNSSAIEDARYNAKQNGLSCLYKCQSAEFFLESTDCSDSIIVMDPPRKGCDQRVLQAIICAKPKRIGFISCNVDTLGRDLRVLVDAGYQIDCIQSVEMFCHSPHLEIVVILHV